MSAYPLIHDQLLVQRTARAHNRIAPVRKHWQRAFGFGARSTPSRHYSGELPSPATQNVRTIEILAAAVGCDAYALIAEEIAVANQVKLRGRSRQWLEAELEQTRNQVIALKAACERMDRADAHPEDQAVADLELADALMYRAALRRQLYELERTA